MDFGSGNASIFQSLLARCQRFFNQIAHQRFEFRPGNLDQQMFRTGCISRNKRQIHFSLSAGGQFDLGFFRGFFQTLQSQLIGHQINAVLFLELFSQILDQHLIKVFTAKEGIAIGGLHFEYAIADFKDGNIKRSTAQIVNGNQVVLFSFIQTVSQCRSSWLVDDAQYVQTGNRTGVFGGLTLRVVEIGRYGNHRISDGFAQIIFGCFLHFLQGDRRDFLRTHFLAIGLNPCIAIIGFDDRVGHQFMVMLCFC